MNPVRLTLLPLLVLGAACGIGAHPGDDTDLVDPLRPAGMVTVTGIVAPALAVAGDEVLVTLTASLEKTMLADLVLFIIAPDGSEAYRASWPAQSFPAGKALTFTETIQVEQGDQPGAYAVGARLWRTGNSKPLFEGESLATLTVQAATPTGTVLLVSDDSASSAGNQALVSILTTAGYSVATRLWSAPEDYSGVDVIVFSIGNPGEGGDSGRYINPPVGVVAVDSWRPLGMGRNLGFEKSSNQVEVVAPSSPLAGGTSGIHAAYLEPHYITWELDLSASPEVIVARPGQPGQAVVFAYESGSRMHTRWATTRHVGLGYHKQGLAAGLTDEARAQLLAALAWAKQSPYAAPQGLDAPANLQATAGDGQAALSWSAVAGADVYALKRSTNPGGPYASVITNLVSTSYADTGLSNGTTYHYVVTAINGSGASADSSPVSATPTKPVVSPPLAMLATADELAMWRQRAVHGPFRVLGDFSTHSPPHWTEMKATMSNDFASARWSGPTLTTDGRVDRMPSGNAIGNDPPGSARRNAHDLMSAAYAALITDDNVVAAKVKAEIRWHADQAAMDWSNRTRFPFSYYNDLNPLFMWCIWSIDLIRAYDIVRAMGHGDARIEQWFQDLAELSEQTMHANLKGSEPGFANRRNNDYSVRGASVNSVTRGNSRLANGSIVYHPHVSLHYNNRRDAKAGFIGLAGVLTGNQFYVEESKRYIREWMMFGHRLTPGQETFPDHDRGKDDIPQLGLNYDLNGLAHMLPAMEAIARSGDRSLYDFSSSEGAKLPGWGTDHFKTMEQVLDQKIRWIDGTITPQYTGSGTPPAASVAGDEFYRIKSRRTSQNREQIADGYLLMAANYYKRPDWVKVIMRQGTPTGFTNPPIDAGTINGWRPDGRSRFLRAIGTNPYPFP